MFCPTGLADRISEEYDGERERDIKNDFIFFHSNNSVNGGGLSYWYVEDLRVGNWTISHLSFFFYIIAPLL